MTKTWIILLTTCVAGAVASLGGRAEDFGSADKPVEIGLCASLFRDMPDGVLDVMAKPFGILMAAQTGMVGRLVKTGDADDLGQRLHEQKTHLGVFHGYEFAWARQKYPELKPLVLAVNQRRHVKALLMVRADSDVTSFADLKGKTLDMPHGSWGHCHLFLEHRCHCAGHCPMEKHLGKVCAAANSEEALDEVVDGTVDATVVDSLVLDCYKRRKPGRFAELKVAVESELFPAGVVAYRPGALDEKTLGKFRESLLTTHKTMLGRQLLTLWRLTGYEPIPDDFEKDLSDIVKAYPRPE
jgi:ABC-type phosphate/phosphonate transport system substrate-binding protein